MGLFDIFSNSDAQAAADAQTSAINTGMQQAGQQYGYGINAINQYYPQAATALQGNYLQGLTGAANAYMGAGNALQGYGNTGIGSLYGAYGQGTSGLGSATQQGLGALYGGYGQGIGSTNQLYNQALGNAASTYGAGISPYYGMLNTANQGVNQYGNALGLNGAAGNAQALAAFQNNPGYQFQLSQGLAGVDAANAAAGKLGSGNNMVDAINYAEGLAGTSWNSYLSQLQPYLSQQQAAASGIQSGYNALGGTQAGLYQGQAGQLGNLYSGLGSTANQTLGQYGTNYANLMAGLGGTANQSYANIGTGLAGLQSGYGNLYNQGYQGIGTGLGNIYTGQGNTLNSAYQGLGNMYYGGNAAIGQAQAQSDYANLQASENMWASLLGGAKNILSMPTNSIGGSLISGLTKTS